MTEQEEAAIGKAWAAAHVADGNRMQYPSEPPPPTQAEVLAFARLNGHPFTAYDVSVHFKMASCRSITDRIGKLRHDGKLRVVETGKNGRMVYQYVATIKDGKR